MAQRKARERARDSRGRPIPGLYLRDGKFSCTYQDGGRRRIVNLASDDDHRGEEGAGVAARGDARGTRGGEGRHDLPRGLRGVAVEQDDLRAHGRARALPARPAPGATEGSEGAERHRVRHRSPASADARRRTLGLDGERRLQDREGRLRTRAAAGDRHEQSLRRAHERRAAEAEEQGEDRAARQRDHEQAHRRREHGALEGGTRARGSRGASPRRGSRASVGRHRPGRRTRSAFGARCFRTAPRRRRRRRRASARSRSSPSCAACSWRGR